MIKVECVSCKSPYDVDERRIPDKGMKMRCPKCSASFMVARDGTASAIVPGAARPPLAPPVMPAPRVAPPAAAKQPAATEPTEPIAPQVAASSLLTSDSSVLQPSAATQPKLGDAPSTFNRTLLGASSQAGASKSAAMGVGAARRNIAGATVPGPDAPKPAPAPREAASEASAQRTLLGASAAGAAAKPAPAAAGRPGPDAPAQPAAHDSGADLPAVKPAPRPAVPWGSLAPPAPDARSHAGRAGGAPGGLPKGAIGAASGHLQPGGAATPVLKSASAGSAFGTTGKQTLVGPGRANAPAIGSVAVETKLQPTAAESELADLPAPRGAHAPEPLIDLPAAKPSSAADKAAAATRQGAARRAASADADLPLVDLPAAKAQAARPLGLQDVRKPANTVDPAELELQQVQPAHTDLVDLPAPRPGQAQPGFAGKHVATPSAEQPIVDLPAPSGIDLPSPKTRTALGAFAAAPKQPPAQAPEPQQDMVDLPAPKPMAPTPFRGGRPGLSGAPPEPERPSIGSAATIQGIADLPAPKVQADLPARKGSVGVPVELSGVDLPTPKASADVSASEGFADLPAVLGGVDLPTPKGSVDLPTPKGSVDLPTPKGSVDLPTPKGSVDLPTPKGLLDLPTPVGAADLPTPKGLTDLPVSKGDDGFGMLDLPVPRAQDEASFGDLELPDLPVRAGFGDVELPVPQRGPERTPSGPLGLGSDEANFGDLDLDGPLLAEESFADIRADDLVQLKEGTSTPPALRDELERDADAFGEAGLLDDGAEEDMEFGIAEGDEGLGLPPELLRRNKGEASQAEDAARGKRALRVLIGVAAALVLVGGTGALLGLTDYGFFGVYFWEQYLPEAGDARFAHEAIARAEKTASSDTYRDVQRSLSLLGEARHKAGLNRELLSRSLLHESLFNVRFGTHAASAGHAAAIMARLEERHGRAPGMTLGRAADAARRGDDAQALSLLSSARAESQDDAYFSLLEGEVALRQSKLAEADKAFVAALKRGGAARAQWGLARVALARTDVEMQRAAVEETLRLSPEHVEARLALARLLWNSGKQSEALTELDRALGRKRVGDHYLWGSKAARANGYSMLGYVHESRGHLSQARKAYDEALAADPYLLEALLGAGRVLLREHRWNDALARFESALNLAQKSGAGLLLSGRRADVEARLGQSHAQLALNRAEEAKATLADLMKDNPNDAEIVRAAGQAEDVLGNPAGAEELLVKAVELAPTTFASYLALAQHYFKQGRADKASETLNEAAAKVEENVEMRRMLGQSELARSRFDSAVHEFKRAIELDPDDLDARFGLATAYRKLGELEEARALLDSIAKRDPQYAGLALERGLLLEAQGKYDEAVQSYRAAHAKDPSDTALNLRLGAAQVEAGHLEDAELTLQTVMRETPNSAEAEYFAGRLALARGRGPDALTHFDRALSLDATQAVYHLYAARAALDMGNLGRTMDEAEAALARDSALGDAYWVRGIVRLRSGAVRDALKDAKRALDLNPNRTAAYALMAECYDELRQLSEAARTYRVALAKEPERAQWWYKFGRLSVDRGARADAEEALEKARRFGDKLDPPPYWLPDAYRLSGELARAAGDRKQAVTLFRRYLAIAPDGALDRDDVRRLLMSWEIELNP